ncbi:NUDIX domain-containing protein [Phytophthora infestans]|uniref:NUDIX domain-containing protein n=1 Tax=Phytophthora infestans TaxID=4787 RepID=A0A8S9TUV4_PHYIN|nr:NUDIX domain-containing protein [Phytophthora infestans]
MRVLFLVLLSLASVSSIIARPYSTLLTIIESNKEDFTRELAEVNKQAKRFLRQYDFNALAEPNEERGFSGMNKAGDVLKKADDLIGKAKIPANLNAAVEKAAMKADDVAPAAVKVAAPYPKDLSSATMKQIQKVEQLRAKDLATYTKKTSDGMRRKIEPFPGIKIAPEKYLGSHVGRQVQRYADDDVTRLLSSAVISRSPKEGGGDVLLISSSKPKKNDWFLPKGGWDKGEVIETAALREVIEEGGVNGQLEHSLGQFSDSGHIYYAYKMKAGTIYDDWAESVRYRLWVSYDDAIKLLVK